MKNKTISAVTSVMAVIALAEVASFIMLAVLRLCNIINWSWWLVTAPLWGGTLLTGWKTPTESKAVVIRNRHLGQYQNGKSLLAKAIGMIRDLDSSNNWDEYGFQDVNPNADVILIDDVDRNFKFQRLFTAITDDLVICRKNQPEVVVPWVDSPKFVLTTNDYIKGANEGSAKRRIAYVDVSGHYSPAHTPIDEFGHLMFKGWDKYQWQLFDNFMMECIMWYFRSYNNNWGGPGLGIVPPPEKV